MKLKYTSKVPNKMKWEETEGEERGFDIKVIS